jgi:quercetin dioxygenase-like cupin family protein
MRRTLCQLVAATLVGCAIGFWAAGGPNDAAAAQSGGTIKATRMFTGPDGLARFEDFNMKVDPKTNRTEVVSGAGGVQFSKGMPGSFTDWHPEGQRQYVIAMRGQLELTASGGEKRVFGPGDILLAEDTTGKGHQSRTVGNTERVSIIFAAK